MGGQAFSWLGSHPPNIGQPWYDALTLHIVTSVLCYCCCCYCCCCEWQTISTNLVGKMTIGVCLNISPV